MSLLDLFRSEPRTTTAVAERKAPSLPLSPSPEELERQREAAAQLEAEQKLSELRSAIALEAVGLEMVPEQFSARQKSRGPRQIEQEINQHTAHSKELEARHKAALAELLPVEASLKEALDTEYHSLHRQLYQRISQLRVELDDAKLDEAYQRIDMSFMSRRKWSTEHQCALPLFSLFNIDAPDSVMEGHSTRSGHEGTIRNSSLAEPRLLLDLCAETAKLLAAKALQGLPSYTSQAWALSSRFAGGIPAAIRQKIAEAKPRFEQIYLVAEAPEWKLEFFQARSESGVHTRLNPKPIPQRDPLVIGQKQGKFWFIDAFDTTPAEEYVRKEFTIDRIKPEE